MNQWSLLKEQPWCYESYDQATSTDALDVPEEVCLNIEINTTSTHFNIDNIKNLWMDQTSIGTIDRRNNKICICNLKDIYMVSWLPVKDLSTAKSIMDTRIDYALKVCQFVTTSKLPGLDLAKIMAERDELKSMRDRLVSTLNPLIVALDVADKQNQLKLSYGPFVTAYPILKELAAWNPK